MKKLLLTTAFVGAFGYAGAANAANLQVNVGGFLDFQAGYTSDDVIGDSSFAGNDESNEINFNTDTEIHVSVEGKADNGLEYGAVVELEADVNAGDQDQNGGANADKAYAYLQGGWGRAEMGNNTDASEALSVNTATFASATGGVDGDFYRYTRTPANAALDTAFLVRPDLPLADAGNSAVANEDATKVTYYTPRFSGFQAGVSYAPNSGSTGVTAPSETGFEDVWAAGVNYSGQWDSVGLKAAITGQSGDAKAAGAEDLTAWDAGVNVAFAGFTVGGSYGDWDDTVAGADDTNYWDLGLGYAAGPWSASVTYLTSEIELAGGGENEFDNIVVGVDYQLAPGLVPYAEVSFFDADAAGGAAGDNEGTIVIVGSELTF